MLRLSDFIVLWREEQQQSDKKSVANAPLPSVIDSVAMTTTPSGARSSTGRLMISHSGQHIVPTNPCLFTAVGHCSINLARLQLSRVARTDKSSGHALPYVFHPPAPIARVLALAGPSDPLHSFSSHSLISAVLIETS